MPDDITIIPLGERSDEPLEGASVLKHPDLQRANQWVLEEYEAPTRDLCVFVPCSVSKPYHESPSHRNYDRVIFSLMGPGEVHVVVFGTCGVTPRELDEHYPYTDYDFMLGKCDVARIKRQFIRDESRRLKAYLEKTRENYQYRVAYCLGDFRRAMQRAIEETDISVRLAPERGLMERMKRTDLRFPYGSLSTPEYLQNLADIIAEETNREPIRVGQRTNEDDMETL